MATGAAIAGAIQSGVAAAGSAIATGAGAVGSAASSYGATLAGAEGLKAAVGAGLQAASLGATVHGGVQSYEQGKAAERFQKRASIIEQAKAAQQNARQRRKAIAAQNIAIAQRESAAAQSGVSSSAQQTGISAIQTQTGESIGFQRGQEAQGVGQIAALNQANSARAAGDRARAVGSLPGQLGMSFGDLLANPGQLPDPQRGTFLQQNPNTVAGYGYPIA